MTQLRCYGFAVIYAVLDLCRSRDWFPRSSQLEDGLKAVWIKNDSHSLGQFSKDNSLNTSIYYHQTIYVISPLNYISNISINMLRLSFQFGDISAINVFMMVSNTQSYTHTQTVVHTPKRPMVIKSEQFTYSACFWTLGENRSTTPAPASAQPTGCVWWWCPQMSFRGSPLMAIIYLIAGGACVRGCSSKHLTWCIYSTLWGTACWGI